MSNNILEFNDYDFSNISTMNDESCTLKKQIFRIVVRQSVRKTFLSKQQRTIFYQNLITVVKQYPNLYNLEFFGCTELLDSDILNLGVDLLIRLQFFCLDGCELLTGETFAYVSIHCCSLVALTFICPTGAQVFYKICSEDLISLVDRNKHLKGLSLMLFDLDYPGLSAIINCGHIAGVLFNIFSFDNFINSPHFVEIVMNLLATAHFDDVGFYINSEPLYCFLIDDKSLVVCCSSFVSLPDNFGKLLINVFKARREMISSVSLTGIMSITNEIMTHLANTTGSSLCDVMISACGELLTKRAVKYLANRCTKLKFVLIRNGGSLLGPSGRCYRVGGSVLALLDSGDKFSQSELDSIRPYIRSEDMAFIKSNNFCSQGSNEEKLNNSTAEDDDAWAAVKNLIGHRV
jgi:hypothetical protein